jgi:hypothetical protein
VTPTIVAVPLTKRLLAQNSLDKKCHIPLTLRKKRASIYITFSWTANKVDPANRCCTLELQQQK